MIFLTKKKYVKKLYSYLCADLLLVSFCFGMPPRGVAQSDADLLLVGEDGRCSLVTYLGQVSDPLLNKQFCHRF